MPTIVEPSGNAAWRARLIVTRHNRPFTIALSILLPIPAIIAIIVGDAA